MSAAARRVEAPIERVEVSAYTVPTERPEADGTLDWAETTVLLVELGAHGAEGIGFAYTGEGAARVVDRQLAPAILGLDALDVPAAWTAMVASVRNLGLSGLAASAVSAVDVALWDLKAKLLGLPLAKLLGCAREQVPAYASGGFTTSDADELCELLEGWAEAGFGQMKLKVGRAQGDDLERVAAARERLGPDVELFVDANGAYSAKRALRLADELSELGVTWFEEPVGSDDVDGLRLVRERAPAPVEVAAGEYGYRAADFLRLLEAGAVDVLQADATRCLGITGFRAAAELADAFAVPLSAHTAPALHVHPCCAVPNLRHLEWFHDHVRIERLLFDGVPEPAGGLLAPDLSRPGLGVELRRRDAEPYLVERSGRRPTRLKRSQPSAPPAA